MLSLIRTYLDFYRDTRGLTVVEYAVAGGLIAAAVILAFVFLGTTVENEINGLAGNISSN